MNEYLFVSPPRRLTLNIFRRIKKKRKETSFNDILVNANATAGPKFQRYLISKISVLFYIMLEVLKTSNKM